MARLTITSNQGTVVEIFRDETREEYIDLAADEVVLPFPERGDVAWRHILEDIVDAVRRARALDQRGE